MNVGCAAVVGMPRCFRGAGRCVLVKPRGEGGKRRGKRALHFLARVC